MSQADVKEKTKNQEQILESKKYKVILFNDNQTTFEFVIKILKEIFQKDEADAHKLTMQIHLQGSTIAGIYSKSMAETKKQLVHQLANEEGCPFRCDIEEL